MNYLPACSCLGFGKVPPFFPFNMKVGTTEFCIARKNGVKITMVISPSGAGARCTTALPGSIIDELSF